MWGMVLPFGGILKTEQKSYFHAADFVSPVSKEVGMTLSNFQRSLAAVLLGNLIYFAILMPILPPIARHGISHGMPQIDLGLVIDFVICAALYILFGRWLPEKKRARQNPHP
jgi:Kef-type K+ transport system membrane component KefB